MRRLLTRPAWLAAAALVAAAAACGGSGDKAGGKADGPTVVLSLATHDRLYAHESFARAIERLSGGTMRVEIRNNWRDVEPGYENALVADVRTGKAELGIVAVRVWDTLGVGGFRALLAPLLVDSLALEARALESPHAARALAGVRRAGVVGIAVLPGTLRRPLGLTRVLAGPESYAGGTFGIRAGGVADATVRALGGTPDVYAPGAVSHLDGAELDLSTIADAGYDQGDATLTSNVALWPRAQTVVMNRRAYEALSPARRTILRRAGREAAAAELARLARDEERARSTLCQTGRLALATASPADVAALRAAVRPVYDELARDPATAEWLAEIVELRGDGPTAPTERVRCPGRDVPTVAASSKLEGRWRLAKASLEDLLATGITRANAEALMRLPGTPALVFADGRHTGIDLETGEVLSTGTYELDGDVVSLVFESGVALEHGKSYELRWSVYRDSLTFSAVPGREPLQAFILRPWRRVP